MKKAGRRKFVLVEGDDTLVSFGVGILLDEFIHRLGLPELIDRHVRVKERERGYRESEAVLGLAVSMITGGECLDDLLVLREESGISSLRSHGEIPYPTTMGDFLRRFTLGHIRQLEGVLAECFRRVYAAEPKRPRLTLDIDSTLDEVFGHQQGARMAYTGIRALNPLMGFIRETGDWLHGRLRAGNAHTADGAVSFLGECVHKARELAERIHVAMDSGFYDKAVVAECERLGVGFTITARQTAPLMRAIGAVPEEAWAPLPGKPGVWVSETLYKPHGWPREYRMLLRREKLPQSEQPTLLETFRYRYHAIVTNRDGAVTELVPEHLLRATTENFIRETKYGLLLDRFPCGEFHANWAYLTIGMLAYNLVSWIKRLALPGLHKKKLLKRLRYRFFNVAARVIHHGRYRILKVARGLHRLMEIREAYERIWCLQFG